MPPYIRKGLASASDKERYQTVFAQHPGSAAAPTAGLHFTPELIAQLQSKDIGLAKVTLHVGLDTFRPIRSQQLADHKMHSEWGRIDVESVDRLQRARKSGGRIVAVGTTSVRVLESASSDGVLRPWRLVDPYLEYCCWCGDPTLTGIYVTAHPVKGLRCREKRAH